uniref:Uncharacterized protein n=1 Tax=Tanacetum cinerariifolium TaxID=118510 RepID=A0A6L2LTA7_TANCI|nr:hypothetical protein [Tanacetum cinerariifolium]
MLLLKQLKSCLLVFTPDILPVFLVGLIVPACLKELIYKVHGLLVLLLELIRFRVLLGELGVGQVVSSVIGGILSIEARDMDTKLLSALESNNTLTRCWFRRNIPVTKFEFWHDKLSILVVDCSQWLGTVSSIPTVLSWGGSIRPEGFWPSILLLMVIIVTIAIVVAVVLVIVDTIIGIVVIVVGAPSIIKLAFMITGSFLRTTLYYLIHQPLGYVVSSVIGGILSIEARDMDTKLLSALESNNTLTRCWFRRNIPVTKFEFWHDKLSILVVDCSQWLGTVSSIPTVLSWGGSIRPEGFWPSILLLMVIIVTVAIVVAVVLVIVDTIIGIVVIVVRAPSIIKLAFMITGWAYAFHKDKASSVRVPVANVTFFSSAQLLRENTNSVRSNQRMSPTAPSVPMR